MPSFTSRPALLFRNLFAFISTFRSSTGFLPSAGKEQVEGAASPGRNIWFEEDTYSVSHLKELSLFLGIGVTPTKLLEALNDLQGYFDLTRLVLQAPHLVLGDRQQMVAVQALSGAVIHMSLLTHLSLPESLVTEGFLLHVSLLPRLETLTISSTPSTNNLSEEKSHGFVSLRSLDVPNEKHLRRFLSYQVLDLEILKVKGLGRNTLPLIARKFPGLRQLFIEGAYFSPPEIFVLGACFQMEEIGIMTQFPLRMDDPEIDRFRAMFRNLRSLSIAIQDR